MYYEKLKFKYLALMLLLLLNFSCNKSSIFKERVDFDNYKWFKNRPVTFETEIKPDNINKPIKLELNLRYIQGFPYKFLHLKVFITNPNQETEYQDVSVQIVADDMKYNGDGAGDYWDLDYLLDDAYIFKTPGKYKFEIKSFMDDDPVNFINSVGLNIEKTTK